MKDIRGHREQSGPADPEVDPAQIPLPEPANLYDLPAELLESISGLATQAEPLRETSQNRLGYKSNPPRPTSDSTNHSKLNLWWVCRATLFRYMPSKITRAAASSVSE